MCRPRGKSHRESPSNLDGWNEFRLAGVFHEAVAIDVAIMIDPERALEGLAK
jgi:hypothetical protein